MCCDVCTQSLPMFPVEHRTTSLAEYIHHIHTYSLMTRVDEGLVRQVVFDCASEVGWHPVMSEPRMFPEAVFDPL